MNNQEKVMTRLSTQSKFANNIITSRLIFHRYSLLLFSFFWFLSSCFLGFFMKLKIYILSHIRLCRMVSDKKMFTRSISGKFLKISGFFCLIPISVMYIPSSNKKKYLKFYIEIVAIRNFMFSSSKKYNKQKYCDNL